MSQSAAWRTADGNYLSHFHASVEMLYLEKGSMRVVLDGEEMVVHAGECFVVSPYMIHSYQGLEERQCLFAIIPMTVVPMLAKTLGAGNFSKPVFPDEDGHIRTLMSMMTEASENENQIMLKGLSYALLGAVIEHSPLIQGHGNTQSDLIRDVLRYIHEHIDQPLSVQAVAAAFGYSESRFAHLFNEKLKRTLHDYVRQLRCQQAAQLLRETDMPVPEIAISKGFTSLQTFYRAFRHCYGITPAAYRGEKTADSRN